MGMGMGSGMPGMNGGANGGGQRRRGRGGGQASPQQKQIQHLYGGKESSVSQPNFKTFMSSKGDNIWLIQYYINFYS